MTIYVWEKWEGIGFLKNESLFCNIDGTYDHQSIFFLPMECFRHPPFISVHKFYRCSEPQYVTTIILLCSVEIDTRWLWSFFRDFCKIISDLYSIASSCFHNLDSFALSVFIFFHLWYALCSLDPVIISCNQFSVSLFLSLFYPVRKTVLYSLSLSKDSISLFASWNRFFLMFCRAP